MTPGYAVYDDGVLRITRTGTPPGLAIAGEIDESTYAALVTALAEASQGHGPVHIDLSGVVYCDLAGLRAIVRLAGQQDGGAGRPVRLHHVPHQLRAVLEIIGWDTIPGVALDEPGRR
jgi:ABC-type transporter Mla MlaB component